MCEFPEDAACTEDDDLTAFFDDSECDESNGQWSDDDIAALADLAD